MKPVLLALLIVAWVAVMYLVAWFFVLAGVYLLESVT